jgi:uncharacterized protein YoxC
VDLVFHTDLTDKLNELNSDLQGKNETLIEMSGIIDSLEGKQKLLKTQPI